MKKLIALTVVLTVGLSTTVLAKTIHVKFDGNHVARTIHMRKNDVVCVETSVPVGQCFIVSAHSKKMKEGTAQNFEFLSSVEGIPPERHGFFMDRICASRNPGNVTYTFVGRYPINAIFDIR